MRYFIYARRSSEDKNKQVQSIPDQLDWAERVRVQRGLDIINTFTDTKTGTEPGREGFNRMLSAIKEQPEPVGILCWNIDRLSRNPIDEGLIKFALIKKRVKHILTFDREFHDCENQIIMGVEFGSATQYSITLGKNVKRGMDRKVEKGWRPGIAPLGYLNDPHGLKGERRIFRDPAAWDKVRRLWDLLLTGSYSVLELRRIATNEMGLRNRNGGKLNHGPFYKLFHNPFYAGFFHWNGKRIQGKHEPMITLAEFDRAQRIISGDKPRLHKHRPLWNGLLRCGECGCMITTEPPKVKVQQNGNRHVYHYLRCSKKREDTRCGQPYLRQSKLESQIEELLGSIHPPKEFVAWATEQLSKARIGENKERARHASRLKMELDLLESKIATLIDKLVSGVITDQAYQAGLKQYQREQYQAQLAMEAARRKKETPKARADALFDFAAQAQTALHNGGYETKRSILSALGSNLQLKDRKLHVELHPCFRAFQMVGYSSSRKKDRLEPPESHSGSAREGVVRPSFSVWCTALKLVRNFMDSEDATEVLRKIKLLPAPPP